MLLGPVLLSSVKQNEQTTMAGVLVCTAAASLNIGFFGSLTSELIVISSEGKQSSPASAAIIGEAVVPTSHCNRLFVSSTEFIVECLVEAQNIRERSYSDKVAGTLIGVNSSYSLSGLIPAGVLVEQVVVKISTAYTLGATISVSINGTTPLSIMTTTENDPTIIGTYVGFPYLVTAYDNIGVVIVDIGGTPVIGEGFVYVYYKIGYFTQ